MVNTSRRAAAASPRVWARVISGINRPDRAVSTENGKNSSGSAIPLSAPYCAIAAVRLPV